MPDSDILSDTLSDTIFALSTVAGRSAVAVLRLSGPAAGRALEALTGKDPPAPRRAALAGLVDPRTESTIDHGLVLWFPGPGSFTGEHMAELQLHGGPAVVAAAVDALAALDGLRPAEPGEFTRRAFHNGKLDLAEVEGLADLIAAETEAQRRQALRQMEGALSGLIQSWRDRLTANLAHLEAVIDFPDEGLPAETEAAIASDILGLENDIAQYLDDNRRGERLRAGFRIAILGPPNVGKSSLLNAIARRDAAIVAETAGTTRDVIEVHLDLGGYPVTLLDTAGLRDAGEAPEDPVEQEGVRRALDRAAEADLRLVVFEQPAWPPAASQALELVESDSLVVVNKVDLGRAAVPVELDGQLVLAVSAKSGEGLSSLLERLEAEVAGRLGQGGAAPSVTRARHRLALDECREALGRAKDAELPELAAEDLRLALRALGRITGKVDVEDLLDVIFRDFCIGK
jgi:tRNA modification GTPase